MTPNVRIIWSSKFAIWSDGTLAVPPGQVGDETFSFTKAYHWTHEAGIHYLQRWTSSFTSDQAIRYALKKVMCRKPLVIQQSCISRMLRQSFLTMLKDDFGVRLVGDPQSYFDMPLANQIDLGQGNTVMPYVVSKMANLRVMTKFNYNASEEPGNNFIIYVSICFPICNLWFFCYINKCYITTMLVLIRTHRGKKKNYKHLWFALLIVFWLRTLPWLAWWFF